MRSYSIAVMMQPDFADANLLEHLQSLRRILPFAQFYLYGQPASDDQKLAIQKMDITLRPDSSDNRFRVARRMFTETDADIFVYLASADYAPDAVSSMIHQLVEGRKDMVAAIGMPRSPEAGSARDLCQRLYGRMLENPLSGFRVFSRRFVKSFSAFERGFPIELEWSIHALELDIPYEELQADEHQSYEHPAARRAGARRAFTRLVIHLQARPLKWFGMLTGAFLLATLCYKTMFMANYFGYHTPMDANISATAAVGFASLSFIAAMSGLLLHSHSHTRREIKRLHFQQHTTL